MCCVVFSYPLFKNWGYGTEKPKNYGTIGRKMQVLFDQWRIKTLTFIKGVDTKSPFKKNCDHSDFKRFVVKDPLSYGKWLDDQRMRVCSMIMTPLLKGASTPTSAKSAGNPCDPVPDIHTTRLIMDLYPHTGSFFHCIMGYLTLILILPVMVVLFPVFVGVKLLITFVFFYPYSFFLKRHPVLTIERLKNMLLFPIHHLIYKIFYVHVGIWLSWFRFFHLEDESWYGLDLSRYNGIDDFMNSFGNSKIRWKYRKNLKLYQEHNISKQMIPDRHLFLRALFSWRIFKLVAEASYRKNIRHSLAGAMLFFIRDYYLLLFLPLRVFVYEKNGKLAGLVSYLKKGDTLILCQNIIGSQFTGAALFYDQVASFFEYGFNDPDIRCLSCAATASRAKKACGFTPINFLLTDEYRWMPFDPMRLSMPSSQRPPLD